MEITIEKLVSLVTAEVMKALAKQGVTVTIQAGELAQNSPVLTTRNKCQRIDMSKYKTPILTENHILRLHELTGQVRIPKRTIITPKAKELIKEKQLNVVLE